jgi:hypothetical protein
MASIKLSLTDAAGEDLTDHLTVDLFSIHGSGHFQVNTDIDGSVQVNDIDTSSGPFFRLMISPVNHRVIQAFVSLSETRVTQFAAAVPVDPSQVRGVTAPDFADLPRASASILTQSKIPNFNDGSAGFLNGAQLWTAMDRFPLLKACFLNITAKSAATILPDNSRVLEHMLGIVRIEQDRLFIGVTPELVKETSHSNAFHQVSPALHSPLPGYNILSSYKTFDRYGNLQLTFQRKGDSDTDYACDVDIDDAQGIEHIFQVVRNSIAGPTNPYDIHDILLQQKPVVDPGYSFAFATMARAMAV